MGLELGAEGFEIQLLLDTESRFVPDLAPVPGVGDEQQGVRTIPDTRIRIGLREV